MDFYLMFDQWCLINKNKIKKERNPPCCLMHEDESDRNDELSLMITPHPAGTLSPNSDFQQNQLESCVLLNVHAVVHITHSFNLYLYRLIPLSLGGSFTRETISLCGSAGSWFGSAG